MYYFPYDKSEVQLQSTKYTMNIYNEYYNEYMLIIMKLLFAAVCIKYNSSILFWNTL